MASSHKVPAKPSLLLATVCCAIIHRVRPQWLAVSVSQAAAEADCKPGQISRLATRALARFESCLTRMMRMGRPPKAARKSRDSKVHADVLTAELLRVASDLLAAARWRRRPVMRAMAVGAYQRLRVNHPELTQKRFCDLLGLPVRTLRHWLAHAPANAGNPPPLPLSPPQKNPRPPRRPRFGFDVTVPDTQLAADTTDITAFGVRLKLVAAQDVGGRDQDLFDSVIVDDHESAQHVVSVLTEAIANRGGMQVIVDQGTPYMADATLDALDAIDAEHAPQREGTPTAKATIERAFRSVKAIADPLLDISNRVVAAYPSFKNVEFAKNATMLLVTALLRAYQAGARATRRADNERSETTVSQLVNVAEVSREQARAQHRSARQTLTRIHRAYAIDMPLKQFIRAHRHFPLSAIHEAERMFATQAHRDDIRKRASYFAALLIKAYEPHAKKRRRDAEQQQRQQVLEDERRRQKSQDAYLQENPVAWLRDAFSKLLYFWVPETRAFLFGGVGPAQAHLRGAIEHLCSSHGTATATDIINGVIAEFRAAPRHDLDALKAMQRLAHSLLTPDQHGQGRKLDFGSVYAKIIEQGQRMRWPPPVHLRT
jgi:hypothetical protein